MSLNRTSEDLKIYEGSALRKCYKVEAFLGEGGFGFVTKCLNTETNRTVAIKINQSHPETVKQAKLEIAILKRLRCLDPDTCNIVRWNGFFSHKEHICLEFELLDQSLYDYLNDRNLEGLLVVELKPVLHQLATALNYLGSQRIIHADLKPENIMVVDRRQLPIKVKMIDFGLAHPAFAARPGVALQTTFFRAPEVTMRMPYSEAIDIDMWSLGVTAVELATGHWMYPGDMDYDVLRFIVETQGQPADYVLGSHLYFRYKENSRQRWIFKSPEEYLNETGFKPNETRCFKLRCLDDLELLIASKTGHHSDLQLLVSLIKRMVINSEENNKEVNIQTKSPVKKDSKWKRMVRRITNACHSFTRKLR